MTIKLNGKLVQTEEASAFAIKASRFAKDAVVILNGFGLAQDCLLCEDDELFVINKGVFPPEDELEGMMSSRHTPQIHQKLKKAKVAIAGLGGLGSNIAISLARIGVGSLLLVDFDVVEPSNLNRQSYYIRHLGRLKTHALAEQITEINPFITVDTKSVRVEEENVFTLFNGYDILCEAFDNPSAKAMLVSAALEKLPNIKVVAASGMAGYQSSNDIRTKRVMKNLYLCGDYQSAAEAFNGLMAPRVQICAGHQANMILRLLVGMEEA